jgi:DNA polymerase-3 subunit epsilon
VTSDPLLRHLVLRRPLAFFDCETTGKYPDRDRLIEITIVKLYPDGHDTRFSTLVNPTIPIPSEVSAIHHITDDQVREMPTFQQLAPTLLKGLSDCDLAGYNIRRFDIPLLCAEFKRAGAVFSMDGRRVVDPAAIFFKREPRDLAAALAFFCDGRTLDGAHRTEADVDAAIAVLAGQFARYGDLPVSVDDLHVYCKDQSWIDEAGRIIWTNGVACLGFGKHAGVPLSTLIATQTGRDYVQWMLSADFADDAKGILKRALAGTLPKPQQEGAA